MENPVQKLLDEWKLDSKVNILDLTKELARIYDLQGKYLEKWNYARFQLKSLELEEKRLKLQKHTHYLEGPRKETKEWDYPASGKIYRPDIPMWLDADKQLQDLAIKLEIAKATLDTLVYIIDAIKYRNNVLGNMIKREAFMEGQ